MKSSSILSRFAALGAGVIACGALLANGVTQEVPRGSMRGTITFAENGKVFPGALVTLSPMFATQDQNARTRVVACDKEGRFEIRNLVAGAYTVSVSAQAHTAPDRHFLIEEGKTLDTPIPLAPMSHYVDIYAEQRVFTSSEQAEMKVKGFVEADKLELKVFKLDFDKVVKEGSLFDALAPLRGYYNRPAKDPRKLGVQTSSEEHSLANRDAEGVFIENLKFPALKPGFYWVKCSAGDIGSGTWLNVTDIALVTKEVGGNVTAFVTDLKTGQPVANAELGYALKGNFKDLGKASQNGLAQVSLPDDTKGKGVVLFARSGESRGMVDFQRSEDEDGPQSSIFIYTDRPIYRPGDTVEFKAISRTLVGTRYQVPPPGTATIKIRDADDSPLDEQVIPVGTNGSLHGSFTVNPEAKPGVFSLEVNYNGRREIHPVSVAAYRKPQYSIKVAPEQPSYIRGQMVRMNVDVEYYFGGPVIGAQVSAAVYRSPKWFYSDPEDDYGWEDGYSSGGEYVTTVEVKTDSSGRAVVEFPSVGKDDDSSAENDYEFTVSASVTDDAGQYFDGEGKVTVARGEFGLGVLSSKWIAEPNDSVPVTIEAKKNGTDDPVAGLSVDVYTSYEVWGRAGSAELPVDKQTVTTDAQGKATINVKGDKPGYFVIKAIARDAAGNRIQGRDSVYLEGGAVAGPPSKNVSVKLDKRSYNAGETAKVLVQTDAPGGSALVTVEGERVYAAQVVPLSGPTTVVEFPVVDEYAPNVTVAVAYVREKQFYEANRNLNASLGKRLLQVSVEADKQVYKPGETATYTIRTKDSSGNPVIADVSLGVVDESIYALAQDNTDIARDFYPRRYNRVQTQYSFPEIFLDGGDKAPTEIQIRRKFKDTAYWNPTIQTDASGTAVLQVPLPDNLTQWRATVVACTSDTQVGQVTGTVRARKDLMVRLQGPAFLVRGDRQQVTALVTNDTESAVDVDLNLRLTDSAVEGQPSSRVRVGPGATESVDWSLSVADGADREVTVVATAQAGNLNDGVELKIPVAPAGGLRMERKAGLVKDRATENLVVDADADATAGSLNVQIMPSPLSTMVQSLDDLIDFPYGCTEQTMSRFLPSVVVSKLVVELGLPAPTRLAQVPKIARDSLSRLKKMQLAEGGWGWWEYDTPSPFMTAYVLEGLYLASNAGYPAPKNMVQRGVDWATKYLKDTKAFEPTATDSAKWEREDLVYLAYATCLWTKSDSAIAVLKAGKDLGSAKSLAYRAMAWRRLGNQDEAGAALAKLKATAKRNGELVSWETTSWGVEDTARALLALAQAGDTSLSPGVARYLGSTHWWSTRDTTFAILGLASYLKQSQELNPNATVQVSVNGRSIASLRLTKESLTDPALRITVPMKELTKGENRLEFKMSGQGTVYYSAELRQFTSNPGVTASGLTISRSYHRLEPQPLEDGSVRLLPSKAPVQDFKAGDLVSVELKILSDQDREYLLLEDPIPSGFRVTEREDPDEYETWGWWFSRLQIYDDRVAIFARSLSKGENVVRYVMRAEGKGESLCRPTTAYNMYAPDERAFTPATKVTVR